MSQFHITCTLENASSSINGIAFVPVEVDEETTYMMTANPVSAEVAHNFRQIPGYVVSEVDPEAAAALEAARKLEENARAQAKRDAANAAKRAAKAATPPAPTPPVEPSAPAAAETPAPAAETGEGGEPGDDAEKTGEASSDAGGDGEKKPAGENDSVF